MKIVNKFLILFILLAVGLLSCSEYIEYSPYDISAKTRNLNHQNISKLKSSFDYNQDRINSDGKWLTFSTGCKYSNYV